MECPYFFFSPAPPYHQISQKTKQAETNNNQQNMNNQIQKNVIIVPTKYATQVWFHPKLVSVAFRDTNNFPHHIASAVAADFQP